MFHKICFSILVLFCFSSIGVKGQFVSSAQKNILYINSYNVTYSWGDSVSVGIQNAFHDRKEVNLYFEYLDTKRFGKTGYTTQFKHLQRKYQNIHIDGVILSDNAALEFMLEYGDYLAPGVPYVFGGINNPEDYNLDGTNIYGIKEGVDQDSVIRLIRRVMPGIEKLYFIADSTATSLLNQKYIRSLEMNYKGQIEFVYITNISIDSLYNLAPTLEPGNAIARLDIFQDVDKQPVNSDIVMQEFAKLSSVPIFMDSETSFGKGILGGIINSGSKHGAEMAKLAISFMDNPEYRPEYRVHFPEDNYSFDYAVAKRYGINSKLFPEGSIIINEPVSLLNKYLNYILGFLGVVLSLLFIISVLIININKRKRAEETVTNKLLEIQQKNKELKEINQVVNEVNTKLEDVNTTLSNTNEELEFAKGKAEESNRLKSAFLANMSHEIRTPLNSIVGFSSIINEAKSIEDRERYIKIITRNSEHLLELIDVILDLSRVEIGELMIQKEIVDISSVFRDVVQAFEHIMKKSEVKLIVSESVRKSKIYLETDPVRFRQVLNNLVSNAIKFTDKGYIDLNIIQADPNELVIRVKDTGIGIKPEHHEKIFDRFWKDEDDLTRFYPGTGLGLAISKRLVEALGGKIWVESEKGKGTTFYFTHPYTRNNNESLLAENRPAEDTTNRLPSGLTIAIAEDNDTNLEFLLEVFKKQNISILTFSNGKEIVDYFVNEPGHVDVILMDIKMPKMSGFEASNQIKSLFPSIPIIAQTAYAMEEDLNKIRQSVIDSYITKPIDPAKLIQTINKQLGRKYIS